MPLDHFSISPILDAAPKLFDETIPSMVASYWGNLKIHFLYLTTHHPSSTLPHHNTKFERAPF
jgi:hypothetical protein